MKAPPALHTAALEDGAPSNCFQAPSLRVGRWDRHRVGWRVAAQGAQAVEESFPLVLMRFFNKISL